jgi:DNA-binding response OmpR family regulator
VRSVLRRSAGRVVDEACTLEFGALRIDTSSREVFLDDRLVALTPKEFDLLVLLARSPRQVFSRAQLLEQVWSSSPDYQDPATVTVHVGRIRQKIEANPDLPRWIVTIRSVGYRFEP